MENFFIFKNPAGGLFSQTTKNSSDEYIGGFCCGKDYFRVERVIEKCKLSITLENGYVFISSVYTDEMGVFRKRIFYCLKESEIPQIPYDRNKKEWKDFLSSVIEIARADLPSLKSYEECEQPELFTSDQFKLLLSIFDI